MHVEPSVPKTVQPTGCCAPFDPAPWQQKEFDWHDRLFIKDHVVSLFHVPLNFGRRMAKTVALMDAAGVKPAQRLVLSDEKSPWGADIYVDVPEPVRGATMTTMSGTFLTRVFEGPYRDVPKWVEEMKRFVTERGRTMEKIYFGYTTCPACAKAYGKNYVVLFAKVKQPAS